MARVYAMIIIVMFSFLACGYVYLRPTYSDMVPSPYQVPTTSIDIFDTKWDEFVTDCGGEVIVENYIHARSVFNKKYENNNVEWVGSYVESRLIPLNGVTRLFGSEHAMNIMVKMSPSESVQYPDLVLSVASNILANINYEM